MVFWYYYGVLTRKCFHYNPVSFKVCETTIIIIICHRATLLEHTGMLHTCKTYTDHKQGTNTAGVDFNSNTGSHFKRI